MPVKLKVEINTQRAYGTGARISAPSISTVQNRQVSPQSGLHFGMEAYRGTVRIGPSACFGHERDARRMQLAEGNASDADADAE